MSLSAVSQPHSGYIAPVLAEEGSPTASPKAYEISKYVGRLLETIGIDRDESMSITDLQKKVHALDTTHRYEIDGGMFFTNLCTILGVGLIAGAIVLGILVKPTLLIILSYGIVFSGVGFVCYNRINQNNHDFYDFIKTFNEELLKKALEKSENSDTPAISLNQLLSPPVTYTY